MTKKADATEEEIFDIQGLLRYENRNGKDYYLVEWRGYPIEEATWEPRDNFINPVPEIVQRMELLKSEAEEATAASAAATAGGSDSTKPSKRKTRPSHPPNTPPVAPPSKRSRGSIKKKNKDEEQHHSSSNNNNSNTDQEADGSIAPTTTTTNKNSANAVTVPTTSSGAAPAPPSDTAAAAAAATGGSSSTTAAMPPVTSASRPCPVLQDEAPAEYTFVRSIRKDSARGICVVLLRDSADTGPGIKVPVSSVRLTHPQAVIDFLLERVQFIDRPQPKAFPSA